jgi:Zn-dependent peptidase ImmA (M78 family)
MKTTLNPNVLKWARKRAALSEADLAQKIGLKEQSVVEKWERTGEIDFGKVEKLAHVTHTPIGYLFLPQPPQERLPIKDFRRVGTGPVPAITPDLLDVIYAAQRRQEWFRDYLIESGSEPLQFVGKINITTKIEDAAAQIIAIFKIGPNLSTQATSWQQNLSLHIDSLEDNGVLVMRSGVVGNSNTRKLSVNDFRGFALCDKYAPVIFINSTDSTAAQIFTLAHELVHIFIGESAVSNLQNTYAGNQDVERYCNAVAAEILVPKAHILQVWSGSNDPVSQIRRIAAKYKVSSLVAARRVHDAGFITKSQFDDFYKDELARLTPQRQSNGGNFYNTINARANGRIVQAVVSSTLEGKTLYGEAMNLLGIKSIKVIHALAKNFGYST